MKSEKITVIGSGSWALGFSYLVADAFKECVLLARKDEVAQQINTTHSHPYLLSNHMLKDCVKATVDSAQALQNTSNIVIALPSFCLHDTVDKLKPLISDTAHILVLTKGIFSNKPYFVHEAVESIVGKPDRICVLSGPNHAEEIAHHKISASVLAAKNITEAKHWQNILQSQTFRPYVSTDITGVEVCGAIKNVIAIAFGAASALDVGDNALSVLFSRGIAEMTRFVKALGGNPITCMGLAGIGDLTATCMSIHSRNTSFGKQLALGVSVEEYEQNTHMVVEGAQAVKSLAHLAEVFGIDAPITSLVYEIIYESLDVHEALDMLMSRIPECEFYDI